jgi:hypothetical protein
MKSLKFNGDITLDEVFNKNKAIIYDSVLEKIKDAYSDPNCLEVKVINIEINGVDYSINLARERFISSLENAIEFYVGLEEYEKCQLCVDIIAVLKSKKKSKN